MYGYLRGKITFISPVSGSAISEIWIDVNGVGYKVYTAQSLTSELSLREEATVYLSESSALYGGELTLYGFLSLGELDLFTLLRDLPGVGAKKALEYFDKIRAKSLERFLEAVIRGDSKILGSFFGFSPKTATKILVQLKDKAQDLLTSWQAPSRASLALSKQKSEGTPTGPWIDGHLWEQAKRALVALGFETKNAEAALTKALLNVESRMSNDDRAGAESPVEDETISGVPRQEARSAAMQGDEHRKRRATRPQAARNSLQSDAPFGASSRMTNVESLVKEALKELSLAQ